MQRNENLIYPEKINFNPNLENLDVWGFKDSGFFTTKEGIVKFDGNRYLMSGKEIPNLMRFMENILDIKLEPKTNFCSSYPPHTPKPIQNEKFLHAVTTLLNEEQISLDPLVRLRHGHGHSQYEMYSIKTTGLPRIPDLVLFPENADQVIHIVEYAKQHSVCLIPFGGGTNVTEALLCPENEKRMIVSIDMRRMNRILWIDSENHMAHIEAGAIGRDIVAQLAKFGFTIGHEPDSIEFSTLGGWIATRASGMKKNKYGNIEQLVLDIKAITVDGKIEHKAAFPRESSGIDPREWIFGSEGNFGIILSAVVKIFRTPEVRQYDSIVFPSFENGFAFLRELQLSDNLPASVRLVDNEQFQFSLALKSENQGLLGAVKNQVSHMQKFLVTKIKKFDPHQLVACTLVFEGSKQRVREEQETVMKIAHKYKGLKAGSENGRRGYDLTFSIAYIRDFALNYSILAESFETSVSWSNALKLCENVKGRIWEQHAKFNLPGKPYISCRITQLYDTGVCVYFYYAFSFLGIKNPSEIYREIEHKAREEIIASGGSLSHHHGVGKIRKTFLPELMSKTQLHCISSMKTALDPHNIFGAANQGVHS